MKKPTFSMDIRTGEDNFDDEGYRKGTHENWPCRISFAIFLITFFAGFWAIYELLGVIFGVIYICLICPAYYFYYKLPLKQEFHNTIEDMALMKKIGAMERMTAFERIRYMNIKRGETFDYYKWRDDELRHRYYDPYDDFHLSSAPDDYYLNYGLSESDKKELSDYYDWWDGQLAELHKKEQSVN